MHSARVPVREFYVWTKMRTTFLCCVLLASAVLLATPGCRSTGRVEIDEADNGGEVVLNVGDTFLLSLESNPTTGYGWEIAEIDQGILREASHEYEAESSDLVGSGGHEIWRFDALAAGSTTLQLEYRRPWEEGVEPEKTFSVQVVVR
ncbi:MAG: peptidase inhibitor I42 [Anaerolineae bacterium]|nr:peptidase inhibitor I42 [Anaerolineae bacterium]NIN96645.1 peptidase inhibitor I42 [Anaerolineae bacterium]